MPNTKETQFCYAAENSKLKLTDNAEFNECKRSYAKFLNDLWDYIDQQETFKTKHHKNPQGPYVDPDMMARSGERAGKRINPLFYSDLCAFLNRQEKQKFYTFTDSDLTIRSKLGIELISDQFGFSAPGSFKHPYDVYLIKCKEEGRDKDGAIRNVIKWVTESRTLGGSFLWPKNIWRDGKWGYNSARGGPNNPNSRSYPRFYIEDRVDLTLCEIKHYLNNENQTGDILPGCIKSSKEEKWLRDFKDFAGYVKYFCFEPFVDQNNSYLPYDIVKSDLFNGKKVCLDETSPDYKNREEGSIYLLSSDELEKMFNNVNIMLKERSSLMLGGK